jgi:hypothetical protein
MASVAISFRNKNLSPICLWGTQEFGNLESKFVKHLLTTTLAVAALGMAAPVLAQETTSAPAEAGAAAAQSATAKAGDTVYDQAGEVVGTVEKVEGANFVISTGTNRATLALNTLASGPKGFVIGVTKAQLDEAIVKSQGAAAPAESSAETAAPAQQ